MMTPNAKYEAAGGTVFFYDSGLAGEVLIFPKKGERALTPIGDLVEFIEVVYHGSEIPTSGIEEVEEAVRRKAEQQLARRWGRHLPWMKKSKAEE